MRGGGGGRAQPETMAGLLATGMLGTRTVLNTNARNEMKAQRIREVFFWCSILFKNLWFG